MPKIFISYRRNDSATSAGRIYDRLEGRFGQGQVFMDVDTIRPGLDFVEVVQEAVGSCDALIAVIGREWLGASDEGGRKRLENPEDLVRLEIATALERDIRVIPVLVQGAQMPLAADLPEDLKALARRNSVELSDNRFRTDIDQLIEALEAPTSQQLADSVFVEPAQLSGAGFVGREREMVNLRGALEEALSGQGRMVMLAGEPGIGKTRTAQELAAQAETLGAQVLWGWCYEEEGAPPYWPWIQPLRSYIQQADPEQLASEMGPGAADIADLVTEVREKLPNLEPPPVLEPEQARFRLFDSITTFLKNAARSQPLVLILDDLHWADRSSLLLLQFLAREMSGSYLLVVGTYRDVELSRQHPLTETLAQLIRQPVFRRELLRGLSQEDTQRFVESAASVEPSRTVAETIYSHTGGNPFYMTEVVRLLSEHGDLTSGGIGGSTGLMIPEGVKEVIGQRLNRLSKQCNEVLTTASIIGKEFHFKLLGTLIDDISEDVLGQAIDEAVDAHMVEEVSGSWERYRFSHALVQETLSVEMPTRRKVQLHARIGSALESLFGADVQTHADELAFHFGEAEPMLGPEKFVHYSLLAGEQALAGYALEEALSHFQRGLTIKEQLFDADTAALLFGQGRAQAALLQMQEARTSLTRAFDYYAEAGDVDRAVAVAQYPTDIGNTGVPELVVRALELVPPDTHEFGRLMSHYGYHSGQRRGDDQGAQEAFTRALAIAQREGDQVLEMWTLARAGNVGISYLRPQDCLLKHGQAIELNSRVGDPDLEVAARDCVVTTLIGMGDLDEAESQSEAMIQYAERSRFRGGLLTALSHAAIPALFRGDWQSTRELTDRGLRLDPDDPYCLSLRAMAEYMVGDLEAGAPYLARFTEVMSSNRGPSRYVQAVIPLVAHITGDTKYVDVAREAFQSALSAAALTPRAAWLANIGLALLTILQGDQVEAREQYSALLPVRTEFPAEGHICISMDRLLGLLSQIIGNLDQAARHYEDALVFCRKAGFQPELAWSCCGYADTVMLRNGPGDREKALSLLDESLAIATELGMRPLMERVISRQDGLQA